MTKRRLMVGPWSITLTLSVAIGGLVVVAVMTVLVTQLQVGRANVTDLVNRSIREAFDAIEISLAAHLDPAAAQIEFLGRQIEIGRYETDDKARLRDLMTGALAATPQIEGIVFAGQDLSFLHVRQTTEGGIEILTQPKIGEERLRAISERVSESEGAGWQELVHVGGRTYLNLRRPLRRNGTYLGFLAVLVSMPELSQIVADIGDASGITAFVLYGSDAVLAHPMLVSPHPDLSEESPVVAIDRVGDLVLGSLPTAEAMPGMEALLEDGIEIRRVDLAESAYAIGTKRLSQYGVVPWYIGAWVPMEDMMDAMKRLQVAGLGGLAIAVLAVILAILLGRVLARPIRRAAAESSKVGDLDLEHVAPLPGSPISELDEQAKAFNAMLGGLKSFERYVPRRLVTRLIESHLGSELESEERELTVMFTDIVGFTAMSESLPAGEVARFLNEHFSLLGDCIEAEEGTIDKYIGDALMVFWGAPDLQEDHALRACRAACAIAGALAADNAARAAAGRPTARIRIGLHSGPVVVGNIGAPGRINYTIVGDTVNTCQRLESLGREFDRGDAATVLVSEATARAVGDAFTLEPVGSYEVKGRREQVRAFRLLAGAVQERILEPSGS